MGLTGLLGLLGCSSSSNPDDSNAAAAPTSSSINTALKVSSAVPGQSRVARNKLGRSLAYNIGSAATSELASLQYYITTITICQDMTISGSGFSNASNCIQVYQGPADPVLNDQTHPPQMPPDYVGQANYVRNSNDLAGYIDLTDPDSLEKLRSTTPLDASKVGSYKYGSVGWAYPIRVQAELSDPNGDPLFFTHDGNTVNYTVGGQPGFATIADQNFSDGSAELATVCLPNGGSWFKFQEPFEVTQQDIDNQVQFDLDLTFNPDGIVYGYSMQSAGGGTYLDAQPGSGPSTTINVPMLDLTPVLRRSTEVTRKETYIGSITGGTASRYDVRIEFYSIDSDPDHTILGVSTAPLPNAQTPASQVSFGKAVYVDTKADGSIDLQDWSQTAFVSGFVRGTAIGDSTTVTVACSMSGSPTPIFPSCTNDKFTMTFKLAEVTTLE